jgi:hypothetical protein
MEISGGDKLEAALKAISEKMSGGSLSVGFLEGATYPDGESVAQVAFWNEFGTSRAPARPFMRSTIEDKQGEWATRIAGAAVHYDYDSAKVLGLMGETMKEDFQSSINGWTNPRNADSTIATKGFDKPLIDTGVMLQAVDYRVDE